MTLYAILALVALLAAGGLWLYRRGRQAERGDANEDALQAAVEVKAIEENITRMDRKELARLAADRARRVRRSF